MNHFIITIGSHNPQELRARCESCEEALIRDTCAKVLKICPHTFFVAHPEKDLPSLSASLPTELHLGGQVLLFQVRGAYIGTAVGETAIELRKLFPQ